MEKKYHKIIVEKAIDIPLISAKLTELVKTGESEGGLVLLKHQEGPCIIRGIAQPLFGEYHETLGYSLLNGVPEIRRADGGLTWIHPNKGSYCLNMYGNFKPKDSRNKNNLWNTFLMRNLPPRFAFTSFFGNPDLYDVNDNQVVGTSMSEHVRRACFYEGGKKNIKQQLQDIMEKDSMLEYDDQIKSILSSYAPFRQGSIKELLSTIVFPDSISSSVFIEGLSKKYTDRVDFLQRDRNSNRNIFGYCIGGKYPETK
jgi:hypothetical protein